MFCHVIPRNKMNMISNFGKQNALKVLVLHSSAFVGGAEHSLLELIRKLGNRPIELHMVFSDHCEIFQHVDARIYHQIRLHYLKKARSVKEVFGQLKSILIGAFGLFLLVKKQKIKVVYCNTFRTLPYCLLIKLLLSVRIVCHCRDNISFPKTFRWLKYLADEWIAVSESIRRQFPVFVKIHIVYNGLDPAVFQPEKRTFWLHRKYGLPDNVQLIGNIGQVLPWKNQLDFLSVASLLLRERQDIHFLLVGPIADEQYYAQLKDYVSLSGMEQHVTFTGCIHPVAELLNEFYMVHHTAINEPFGRVLIEAGAMEKPVVAYATGGPTEIIKNGKTGYLIHDGDVKEMAKQASRLINQPLLAESMGKIARERVIARFNSEDYADKVYQILQHG